MVELRQQGKNGKRFQECGECISRDCPPKMRRRRHMGCSAAVPQVKCSSYQRTEAPKVKLTPADIWAQDDRGGASSRPYAEERRQLASGGRGNGKSKGITFTEALASVNVKASCQAADVMMTVRDLSASAAPGKLGNPISRLQEMGATPNGHRGNSSSAEDPQTGKTNSRPGKASQGDADLCRLPYAGKRRGI